LAEKAKNIRAYDRTAVESWWNKGRELKEAQTRLSRQSPERDDTGDVGFLEWIGKELGMKERHAYRFIDFYNFYPTGLPPGTNSWAMKPLMELGKGLKDAPEDVRSEILAKVLETKLTERQVRQLVEDAKAKAKAEAEAERQQKESDERLRKLSTFFEDYRKDMDDWHAANPNLLAERMKHLHDALYSTGMGLIALAQKFAPK
jgi:hypothetical protein